MKKIVTGGLLAAGIAAGAVRRWRSRAAGPTENRWLVVTVNCPPESLSAAAPPEPLALLGRTVEIEVRPAPGGRGTELAARPIDPRPAGATARLRGVDPRQEVRSALRDAKSLIETGEVLRPDTPPTTRSTPGGKLLELATRRAGGEGRL